MEPVGDREVKPGMRVVSVAGVSGVVEFVGLAFYNDRCVRVRWENEKVSRINIAKLCKA